jgi:hypothetical protein
LTFFEKTLIFFKKRLDFFFNETARNFYEVKWYVSKACRALNFVLEILVFRIASLTFVKSRKKLLTLRSLYISITLKNYR